jgi:tetratricopeptide (TPR) repeat protein
MLKTLYLVRRTAKHTFFLLLSLYLSFLPACDISERPLTDPGEIYDKAVNLAQEKSFKQARPLFEESVRLFAGLNRTPQLIGALMNLARTDLELGEFRASYDAAQKAFGLMRKEGDVRGEIEATILQGEIHERMCDHAGAIDSYRSAETSATAFDDRDAAAEAGLRIATVLQMQNNLDDARDEYRGVLVQAQSSNDRSRIAAALEGIGTIYRKQQRYGEALNSYTQGLTSIRMTHNPSMTAKLQADIGLLHAMQGNAGAALNEFRDAVNTLRRARVDKEHELVFLFRLGQVYEHGGKLFDARRYYSEALDLAHSIGDRISENYLYIFLVRCNFNLMTSEQQVQNKERLRQSYEQIARKFQECGHIAGEGYLYIELGKDFERAGDLSKAQDYFLKAVTLDQNTLAEYLQEDLHAPFLAALGITRPHEDWYHDLTALLIAMQRPQEALRVLEFFRTRQLARFFRNLEISLRYSAAKQATRDVRVLLHKAGSLEIEYAARLANTQRSSDPKEMSALRREIDAAKRDIRRASKEIIGAYPNYETLVMPEPIAVMALRKYIPQGALAIEFLPMDDRLYIFAMNRSELFVRTSPVRHDSLSQLMAEYRKLLQDPSVYSTEASAASVTLMTRFAILSTQLYDLLLRPVDDLFNQSLIIVENEEMDGFPFHAIERQDRKGNVSYLIELTSVDYLPALSSLRYRTAASSRNRELVALGNPTGKNWEVDYELRDIRSFFKGAAIMVGLEASWDNLKGVKADILQLSTEFSRETIEAPLGAFTVSNGLVAEQSIPISFEKLSELTAVPVMILSNYYGQGYGLSARHAQFLRLNGVSDVFFNGWLADRKATKFFSEYFYTYLSNGLAPGDAYRQALLNLMRIREISQPHSWAQFFHFGVG